MGFDIGADEDRPDDWGCCACCGRDVDDEAAYNPVTRQSLCFICTPHREPDREDLFERALAFLYGGDR